MSKLVHAGARSTTSPGPAAAKASVTAPRSVEVSSSGAAPLRAWRDLGPGFADEDDLLDPLADGAPEQQ